MPARLRYLRYRTLDGLARGRLDHMKRALRLGVVSNGAREFAFTADNTTNVITVAGQDGLAAGNPRVVVYGNDLPTGLESGTLYWLADAGVETYTLHRSEADAASGAAPVAFTDNGAGAMTLSILE